MFMVHLMIDCTKLCMKHDCIALMKYSVVVFNKSLLLEYPDFASSLIQCFFLILIVLYSKNVCLKMATYKGIKRRTMHFSVHAVKQVWRSINIALNWMNLKWGIFSTVDCLSWHIFVWLLKMFVQSNLW